MRHKLYITLEGDRWSVSLGEKVASGKSHHVTAEHVGWRPAVMQFCEAYDIDPDSCEVVVSGMCARNVNAK